MSLIGLWAAVKVVTSESRVHSVLYLVLAFVNVAGIWITHGVEYLGLIILVVYVGAIAVLFLFIVFMTSQTVTKETSSRVSELVMLIGGVLLMSGEGSYNMVNTSVLMIGQVLYTQRVYELLGVGLVLLIAMIGAIDLTTNDK